MLEKSSILSIGHCHCPDNCRLNYPIFPEIKLQANDLDPKQHIRMMYNHIISSANDVIRVDLDSRYEDPIETEKHAQITESVLAELIR